MGTYISTSLYMAKYYCTGHQTALAFLWSIVIVFLANQFLSVKLKFTALNLDNVFVYVLIVLITHQFESLICAT